MRNVGITFSDSTPLIDEEWIRWNESQWGLRAHPVSYSINRSGARGLEGWLYLDSDGKVRMPPHNPYLALHFAGTDTNRNSRRYRQWMAVSKLLADDLLLRGVRGSIALPPGLLDARALKWNGFLIGVRYTTIIALPLDISSIDKTIMNDVRKARAMGYSVREEMDWDAIHHCLRQSELRKGFSLKLDRIGLKRCQDLMGDRCVRAFVARDRRASPACAIVTLFKPGATALGWASGTHSDHLRNGVMQLTRLATIEILQRDGASSFDLCGSNIETVAAAKANWGGPLVPYITAEAPGLRAVGRSVRDMVKWWMARRIGRSW
jgi:hypothetical protein